MKSIRLFSIVFLVAVLVLPMDVLACADLAASRDEAQTAYNTAKSELDDLENQGLFQTLINLGTSLGMDDPLNGELGIPSEDLLGKAVEYEALRAKINAAKHKVSVAESFLVVAQV